MAWQHSSTTDVIGVLGAQNHINSFSWLTHHQGLCRVACPRAAPRLDNLMSLLQYLGNRLFGWAGLSYRYLSLTPLLMLVIFLVVFLGLCKCLIMNPEEKSRWTRDRKQRGQSRIYRSIKSFLGSTARPKRVSHPKNDDWVTAWTVVVD